MQFRNIIADSNSMAFGCSHTWGIGVEANETWAYNLGAKNFGMGSCSVDYIVRVSPDLINEHKPTIIYILWPDWTRFEYCIDGHYYQSLPTDSNRIQFMETHDKEWLIKNFSKKVTMMHNFCKNNNIKLIDMTLYDLVPYIDHADVWPLSKLGHHYSPIWHSWVADIFKNSYINNIKHTLRHE
jgi:hypothetical protein